VGAPARRESLDDMNNELKQLGQFWYYFAIKMVELIELKMSNSLDNHERVFASLHIAPFAIVLALLC